MAQFRLKTLEYRQNITNGQFWKSVSKFSTLQDNFTSLIIIVVFRASVCKKGLILESGVPVNLHLYPGDCIIPTEADPSSNKTQNAQQANEISNNSSENTFIPLEPIRKFIPTPVVRIGNEAIKTQQKLEDRHDKGEDKNSVFYQWKPLPEQPDTKNELDSSDEYESTRALNTKNIRTRKQTNVERVVEIAEPILKKATNKNARSHNIDKPEITEPILGPTTTKTIGITTKKPILLSKIMDPPNMDYYISDSEWVPSRRQSDAKNLKQNEEEKQKPDNPLRMIMMTVQFLPERLSKMFEQAERYARETIFPLISQATPRFISNFVTPKTQTQYVPLEFTEASTTNKGEFISPKTDFNPPDVPLKLERTDPDMESNTTETIEIERDAGRSNPETEEKIKVVEPQRRMDEGTPEKQPEQIPPNSKVYYEEKEKKELPSTVKERKLYVDLPVFDERDRGIKFIPVVYPDALTDSEKITKR